MTQTFPAGKAGLGALNSGIEWRSLRRSRSFSSMPGRFCTLCSERAVAGSGFCSAHHAQATQFARSFAPFAPPEAPATPLESVDFTRVVHAGWSALATWASEDPAAAQRWPQLALYTLRGLLRARHYYGVVPGAVTPAPKPFYDACHAAMAPQGVVFQSLHQLYRERASALDAGELQMLCVDFLVHQQRVVLAERGTQESKRALCTYVLDGTDWVLENRHRETSLNDR